MINAEKKLKGMKAKFPKSKKRQTADGEQTKEKNKLRKSIENSITVYDSYDETKGDYGKTPPTVITGI
jgi:hypothetical protein